MATINVKFDTKEKTLDILMNGKRMENVVAIDFFRRFDDENKFLVEIRSEQTDDEEDLIMVTRIMANGTVEEHVEELDGETLATTEKLSKALKLV